jgi:hypothetical protein
MRQAQIFPAAPSAKRSISRAAYGFFIGGTALLVIGMVALGVTFAASTENPLPTVAAAGGLICAGGVGLVIGTGTLLRLRQPIQVEVTPDRLVWREGTRSATLEYDEVERVELVKDQERHPGGLALEFPVVRFVEDDGEMIEFEVSFEDRGLEHRARFDARAITAAVLPYVRSRAVVAPTVDEFVNTGLVDVDGLLER